MIFRGQQPRLAAKSGGEPAASLLFPTVKFPYRGLLIERQRIGVEHARQILGNNLRGAF